MFRKNIAALCTMLILLSGLMILHGCATLEAMDKAIADSLNKANADKAAKEQSEQAMQSNSAAQPESVSAGQPESVTAVQTVKVKEAFKTVNVRSEPSKDAPVVTTLPGGMEIIKIGEKDDWIQTNLEMEDGSHVIGWISSEVIEQ